MGASSRSCGKISGSIRPCGIGVHVLDPPAPLTQGHRDVHGLLGGELGVKDVLCQLLQHLGAHIVSVEVVDLRLEALAFRVSQYDCYSILPAFWFLVTKGNDYSTRMQHHMVIDLSRFDFTHLNHIGLLYLA